MIRGIWTKWIISAVFLLLIVAAGCILYYQHTTAPYKQEADKDNKLLQEWEANKKAKPAAETESTQISADSITQTAEKPITGTGDTEVKDTATGDLKDVVTSDPKNVLSEDLEDTESVAVSPYGFGPYPVIPEGYPLIVSWTTMEEHREKFDDNFWRDMELMDRVLIKLLIEGDTHFNGGVMNDGLVLPIYPNVAYVHLETDYGKEMTEDGDLIEVVDSYSNRILAGSGVSEEDKEKIRNGEKPPGVEIRSFSDGINPYTFLGLQ